MTLEFKIKLIDNMIRENPDVTIAHYIELIQELEAIERSKNVRDAEKERKMMVIQLSATMTPAEIIDATGIGMTQVYRHLKDAGIDTMKIIRARRALARQEREEQERIDRERIIEARRMPAVIKKAKIASRPPAEYSNRSAWGIASDYNNQKTSI